MEGQHDKPLNDINFVPKEGQRDLLCCNKKSFRCPSLSYEHVELQGNIDKAFDLLFEEVIKISKSQNLCKPQ